MTTAAPEPKANMGQPVPRYDAVAKVTGRAKYASDVSLTNFTASRFFCACVMLRRRRNKGIV